ncbi:MAG: Hsp20/alpha crystallin family protein [Desulfobacterales bacterium]|nr:Hsp20/alpha crystallin family protein [Desulfobacterales bacterium]
MFKEAEGLFEELRQLHLQAERHFFSLLAPSREGKWQPLADVYETDETWVIKLELAGVRKEDFSLSANKGILTIRGTRKDEFEGQRRTYHQAEINYNEFERSFPLPQGADAGAIKALYKDGLLTITIRKLPASPPERKKITINII